MFETLPESMRNELFSVFCLKTSTSDRIVNVLKKVSQEELYSSEEVFEMTKNYLLENKFKLNENIKQFEKTVNWERLEE